MDLFAEVVALAAAFDAGGIDYAICGGVALAIHGAPRATKDIDILARDQDLDRLRDAVRGRGFSIEALPMTFSSSGISMRRFTKVEPDGRTLMLDVLVADAALDAVWDASRVRRIPRHKRALGRVARRTHHAQAGRGTTTGHRRHPTPKGGRR